MTYTNEQIDKMAWPVARAAAKAEFNIKGQWVSEATTDVLKEILKGNLAPADAEVMVLNKKLAKLGVSGGGGVGVIATATALKPIEDKVADLDRSLTGLAINMKSIEDTEGKGRIAMGNRLDALGEAVQVYQEEADHLREELRKVVEAAILAGPAEVKKKIAPLIGITVPTSTDPITMALEQYASPGNAIKPVIIRGEAGAGKTYEARRFKMTAGFDYDVEIGIHAGMEPAELLGSMTPSPSVPWMDGPLTEAFRMAAAGKKVFLLLDEYYRMPAQNRTPLLTATTKDESVDPPVYRLRTGRPIKDPDTGVDKSEELLAPCHLLSIVATTNVGAQYNVDMGCPAERDRFIPRHVDVDEAKIRAVCSAVAKSKGFSTAVVDRIITFYRQCKVLKQDGFVELCPSTRILSQALQFANVETAVKTELHSIGLHIWAGLTIEGAPEPEQVKRIEAALNTCFKS